MLALAFHKETDYLVRLRLLMH